ncbi:MAG: hypothetical protein B6D59_05210 [Campylobacteraceae bacterium 4484_4]|nr:MAG: hypothetical protein B6D59_05210 [Campylobacteraceae bacterium 4484_4]
MDSKKQTPTERHGKRYKIPSVENEKELNLITFTDEEEEEFEELKQEMDTLVDEIEYQSRTVNNLSVDFIEEVMDRVLLEESEEGSGIDSKKLIAFLNEIIDRNMRIYEANERIREIFGT